MLKMEAPQRSNRVPATKKTQQSLAERSALTLINILNIKDLCALCAKKILHPPSSIIHHPSSITNHSHPLQSLRVFSLAGQQSRSSNQKNTAALS